MKTIIILVSLLLVASVSMAGEVTVYNYETMTYRTYGAEGSQDHATVYESDTGSIREFQKTGINRITEYDHRTNTYQDYVIRSDDDYGEVGGQYKEFD